MHSSHRVALLACLLLASVFAEAIPAIELQHTSLPRADSLGGRGRELIAEAGPKANKSITVECIEGGNCYGSADNFPWGSPNISYPTNGTAWGVSISGPSGYALASDMVLEQLPNYIVTWYTRAPVVGPAKGPAFNPNLADLRCPTATYLYLSTNKSDLYNDFNTIFGPPPHTYSRVLLADAEVPSLVNYSYASPCIRHVVLYDLNPNTLYYYAIPSDNDTDTTSQPRVFSFTTLPIANASGPIDDSSLPYVNFTRYPLVLAIAGDLGQTYNASTTRDLILAAKPQVLLLAGDISYADVVNATDPDLIGPSKIGTNQQRWDADAVLMESLFSRIPTLTCVGNHELEQYNINSTLNTTTTEGFEYPDNYPFQTFAARWPAPGVTENFGNIDTNLYYTTVIGGVVKLIVMNNYVPFHEDTPQYWWALEEFANTDRTVTPWLMVMFHAPIYNSYVSHYKENVCFGSVWEDIFYEYGVDLVINGHVHAYERTHPVYKYKVDTCAPVYITIGDGGNSENLARTFVDEIDPKTNKTYCESMSTPATGKKLTASQAWSTNPYGWGVANQLQVQLPNCPTMTFEPPYSVGGGPTLVHPNSTSDLGFCQSSQPLWSAFRDPAFGFGTLTLLNETTANLNWFRNEDGLAAPKDSVTLVRSTCSVNKRLKRMRRAA